MTTMFHIAKAISSLRIGEEDGMHIAMLMQEFQDTQPRTFNLLMRSPGFRKLWNALEAMAHDSADEAMDADPVRSFDPPQLHWYA